jgi:undecaprenyl-diphosphatase
VINGNSHNDQVTPQPRRFLFLALLGTSLFAIIAILVATNTLIVRLDAQLVDRCFHFANERPNVRDAFTFITDLGAGRPLWLVGAAAIVALALRGELVRTLVWTAGLFASRPVSPWLKAQFERPRPEFSVIDGYSFPSGHAFHSAVVYGMLALVILRTWNSTRWRWAIAGALWIFIAMVALSRPMLGVHYPSDVIAGASLGLAWGFGWATLADWFDLRKLRQDPPV